MNRVTEESGVRNTLSGSVIGNVIQGRDLVVSLPAASPMAVTGIPAQPVFVGREAELALLAEVLAPAAADSIAAGVVVLAVAGLPGVGKTALVVKATHDATAAGWFPGGVLMVDMRGYDPPERHAQPSAALASLLGALGIASQHIPPGQADRSRLWRSVLATRETAGQSMLILVDNVSSSEQVQPLLPGTIGHRVLITTRNSLADLDGTRLLEIDVLSPDQTVDLLGQTLSIANPDDGRVDSDRTAAMQLGQLCGGLPLAVRIAAAQLAAEPERPIAELVEGLAEIHGRLEKLSYEGSLSARAAFDMSYEHLTKLQARLFRLLSFYAGSDISAEAVAAMAGLDVVETRQLIGQLRRANLLQPGNARDRWRMHNLLRTYAWDRPTPRIHRRDFDGLFSYYLKSARTVDSCIDSAIDSPNARLACDNALSRLDNERQNLVDVVAFAHHLGRHGYVVDLALALSRYFGLRQDFKDWIDTHLYALISARKRKNKKSVCVVLSRLSDAFLQSSNDQLALACDQQVLKISRKLADRAGEGRALLGIGRTYRFMGQRKLATHYEQQALGIFRDVGDRAGEAEALHAFAWGLHLTDINQCHQASDFYLRALAIYREIGDRSAQAEILNNLGVLHGHLQQWDKALRCHRQAAAIGKALYNPSMKADQMRNMASCLQSMDHGEEAADCWRQAAENYRRCGDRSAEIVALRSRGHLFRDLEKFNEAADCYQLALGISRELKDIDEEAETLAYLGDAHSLAGRRYKAEQCWKDALATFRILDRVHAQTRVNQLQKVLADLAPRA